MTKKTNKKMEKPKIKKVDIREEIHTRLDMLRAKNKLRTFSATIEYLLNLYDKMS